MARGVKTDRHAAYCAGFAIGDAPGLKDAQPVADDGQGLMGGKIGTMAGPCVIGMAMCDQRPFDGPPRVDVEVAVWALDATVGKGEDGRAHFTQIAGARDEERAAAGHGGFDGRLHEA